MGWWVRVNGSGEGGRDRREGARERRMERDNSVVAVTAVMVTAVAKTAWPRRMERDSLTGVPQTHAQSSNMFF